MFSEKPSSEVKITESIGSPEATPNTISDEGARPEDLAKSNEVVPVSEATESDQPVVPIRERLRASLPGFIFSGVVLVFLPMWNSAVFLAAASILGGLFFFCPFCFQL